ncbi:MAG: hypothetical protein HYV09_04260 [Deltaproteobacteria bacterium]|nr:hypothetical protein [Deltaproteobacteria bacterium]
MRAPVALTTLLLASAYGVDARGDTAWGNVAVVDSVEWLPTAATANRLRIHGAIATFDGTAYGPGRRGVVELQCAAGREADCRAQWSVITAGSCVGFGWDVAPAVVQPEGAVTTPAPWPLVRGVRVLPPEDPACGRARAVVPEPTPAPVAAAAPEIAPPATAMRPKPRPDGGASYRWYGWQLLLLEVPALWGASVALHDRSTPWFVVGAVAFGLGPTFVDIAHRNSWRAIGGTAMRLSLGGIGVFLSVASGQIGGAVGGSGRPEPGPLLVMGGIATLIDAITGVETIEGGSRDAGAASVRVTVGPTGFGLAGRF